MVRLKLAVGCGLAVLTGCTSIPSMVWQRDQTPIGDGGATVSDAGAAGPKVASIVANLKCELWKVANSTKLLPRYANDPDIALLKNKILEPEHPRAFNLRNMFREIAYVASAQWTLDVIEESAFNPGATYTDPTAAAAGLLPATNRLLAVGGSISELPHRSIQINQAIDFTRLVPPVDGEIDLASAPKEGAKCGEGGSELTGALGLEESLAAAIIATSMNDISVFPEDKKSGGGPITVVDNGVFGVVTIQIDFTIVRSIGAGANWSLRYLKAPTPAGGSNLVTLRRTSNDKLTMTFVPVCIRRALEKPEGGRYKYESPHSMAEGTPAWANYVPPCAEILEGKTKVDAVQRAKSLNENYQLLSR